MNNSIKFLNASLLEDKNKLAELTYWLRVMARPNGWHYDLDHIWVLNQLESAGISRGSTVLDAGAGQGIMQYLLASRGINVISLDFSPRKIASRSRGIFQVHGNGNEHIEYKHPYMDFMSYETAFGELFNKTLDWAILKIPLMPSILLQRFTSYLWYFREKFFCDHAEYGRINFIRAPFHDIPLHDNSVDAVISVSALEHSDINFFRKNIDSMLRVLKPGAPLLVTTSATINQDNYFHEKSLGWCFSRDSLAKNLPECNINFEADVCYKSLMNSKVFFGRLDPYYYQDKKSFCYKKKIKDLPYFPIAIKITK
jgi:ubiquinone/menaquinone biosynthesis C-methylase UbiE